MGRMRRMMLLVAAVVTAACGQASEADGVAGATAPPDRPSLVIDGPGRFTGSIVSGGATRSFEIVVPAGLEGPVPLVLVLHGFAGDPAGVEELSGMTPMAHRHGFIVAYPRAAGLIPAWGVDPRLGSADVGYLRDLVEAVSAATPIDRARVYVAGMSNGGGMAARFACAAPDIVAAVAPVAAAHSPEGCVPADPMPVLAFHGTGDRIVPFAGRLPLLEPIDRWAEARAAANGCEAGPRSVAVTDDVSLETWEGCTPGANVRLYVVDGGGHGWPGSRRAASSGDSTTSIDATELIWEFFAAHPGG